MFIYKYFSFYHIPNIGQVKTFTGMCSPLKNCQYPKLFFFEFIDNNIYNSPFPDLKRRVDILQLHSVAVRFFSFIELLIGRLDQFGIILGTQREDVLTEEIMPILTMETMSVKKAGAITPAFFDSST